VIGQMIKTLKTQKQKNGAKCRRRGAFDFCGRTPWFGVNIWNIAVNIRKRIVIGNEFLKIARQVEPPIGSGDMFCYFTFSFHPSSTVLLRTGSLEKWWGKRIFVPQRLFVSLLWWMNFFSFVRILFQNVLACTIFSIVLSSAMYFYFFNHFYIEGFLIYEMEKASFHSNDPISLHATAYIPKAV